MNLPTAFVTTICGIEELESHGTGGVTHVLSVLDPARPDPEAFLAFPPHRRAILRFHDAIDPAPGVTLPSEEDVGAILDFGHDLMAARAGGAPGHLLVHCHFGISRSTAAMGIMLAQAFPDASEQAIVDHLLAIRPQAWPNVRMIGFADVALGRGGRLVEAVRRLHGRQLAARPGLSLVMRELGRGREVDEAIRP